MPSWRRSGVGSPNAVGTRARNGQMRAQNQPVARTTPSQRTPATSSTAAIRGLRSARHPDGHLHHAAPGRLTTKAAGPQRATDDQDRRGTPLARGAPGTSTKIR